MVRRKLDTDSAPKPVPQPGFYPAFEQQLAKLMDQSMSLTSSQTTMIKNFVLADMDGRHPRENRVCKSCSLKLSVDQIHQIVWTMGKDDPCMLCQMAEIKPEAYTKPFTDFLQENPTVFHTVDYFEKKLGKLGFKKVCRTPLELAALRGL